jgi:hypothetical protein
VAFKISFGFAMSFALPVAERKKKEGTGHKTVLSSRPEGELQGQSDLN